MTLLFFLWGAFLWDLKEYRIPNLYLLCGVPLIAYEYVRNPFHLSYETMLWIGVSYGLLYFLFCIGGIGGGDVKLLYLMGPLLGDLYMEFLVMTFLLNGGYCLGKLIMQGDGLQRFLQVATYIKNRVREQNLKPYESIEVDRKRNQIHFTFGILVSYIFVMIGGIA